MVRIKGMDMRDISAGILVGGKSTRMGENKAFLRAGDTNFLGRALAVCEGFSSVVISVGIPGPYKSIGTELVCDEKSGSGPLEGLYNLLRNSPSEYVFIMAVDMPLLTADFLEALAGCVDSEADCYIVRSCGRVHPLCGVYSRRVVPEIERMRENDERKIRLLLDRVKTRYLDIEDMGFDEVILSNVNSPGEYDKLKEDGLLD
ncbi:MAG: molybdenum cofactor guanylyltransferase [Eubacterium sp.]|nr:molybdenum cofactor guanylyltransferase [Eubacterium sp.]